MSSSEKQSGEGVAPAKPQGLPSSTMQISIVAITLATLMSFFALKWYDSSGVVSALEAQVSERTVAADDATAVVEELRRQFAALATRAETLESGELRICNNGSEPLVVRALTSTWIDESRKTRTFNSQSRGTDLWTIEPGRELALTARGAWDGSTAYYGLWLIYQGREYFQTGLYRQAGACHVWPVASPASSTADRG